MAEPDHIFLRPMPNLMMGNKPAAFPFFYIQPKDHKALIRRYVEPMAGPLTDADIEAMDPIGNRCEAAERGEWRRSERAERLTRSDAHACAVASSSTSPNFITKSDLAKLAPVWANFTVRMKTDPECDKAWGWVLEMYAYTAAARAVSVWHDLHPRLAAQPPWDTDLKDFLILHFTCVWPLAGFGGGWQRMIMMLLHPSPVALTPAANPPPHPTHAQLRQRLHA